MNSSADTIYSLYKNAGFCWPLALSALALNAIALPGMAMNFGVIWVTVRTKSLHGTANFLLALCSFYELLHEHGHLLFLWMALSGRNFLPYTLAVRICSVSIFGLGGIALSMAFTGFDRLLCVLFPSFPKFVNPKLYLGLIVSICTTSSTFVLLLLYNNTGLDPNLMITGTIGDISPAGNGGQIYMTYSFVIYNVTIVLYVLVGVMFKWKTVSTTNTAELKSRRIYRALFIIISLNVGGYYAMRIYRLFFAQLASNVANWFIANNGFAILVNLSAASNAPILYFSSKEYRLAFRREFPFLANFMTWSTITQPAAIVTAPVSIQQIQHSVKGKQNVSNVKKHFIKKF